MTKISAADFLQFQTLMQSQNVTQQQTQPAIQQLQHNNDNSSWYGGKGGKRSCYICGEPGCMSWNHPEYSGKGGKGKGGGYGGGWSRQQQPWQQNQPWQQQQWQQAQETPAVDDAAERYNTLSAQLKAKELQLEMLLAKPADAKQEVTEEPEVVRLRQRVQEQEADSRRLKRRLEEQDKIAVEKEMEERVQSRVVAAMEARLRTEMESRFNAST